MHATRHWNHQDLPFTVRDLSHLRQLLRLCMPTLGCTAPLSLGKSTAPPCETLKRRRKAKIGHPKSTVSPVLKDHFGNHKHQRDEDMKAAVILLTYSEDTFFFPYSPQKRRESRNLGDLLKRYTCNYMNLARKVVSSKK